MKTALFSTVHPASAPFLGAFFRSVAAQDDRGFKLWLAFDLVDPAEYEDALEPLGAVQIVKSDNDTPASLRQRALERLLPTCDAVIFVDSDDVLYPDRVSAAKQGLHHSDVSGCALELIAQDGAQLNRTLGAPPIQDWANLMPKINVFGLSNTAYRARTLEHLLPVPAGVTLVDWFLATRAYLIGARLHFDSAVHMAYRQYADNTARVLPPFTPAQITRSAGLVAEHLRFVLNHPPEPLAHSLEPYRERLLEVERFSAALEGGHLTAYTEALNARAQPVYHWWEYVAHKELYDLWNS